jgi:Reverse transcriptase (RNA-dependent DNA polymerase)
VVWYIKLHSTFVKLGFSRCASDHCVWIWAKDGVQVIIPTYVDDLIIACKTVPLLKRIKEELKLEYKIHDLGLVAYTLGIEIIRDRANRRLYLSQRKHIGEVLDRFNMTDACPVSTPLAKSSPLTKEDCPQTPEDLEYMKSVPYLSAVGSLMYLSVGTCPDNYIMGHK